MNAPHTTPHPLLADTGLAELYRTHLENHHGLAPAADLTAAWASHLATCCTPAPAPADMLPGESEDAYRDRTCTDEQIERDRPVNTAPEYSVPGGIDYHCPNCKHEWHGPDTTDHCPACGYTWRGPHAQPIDFAE